MAEAGAAIPAGQPMGVRIELEGPRLRVWLRNNDVASLDVSDPNPIKEKGHFGIRVSGAPLNFDSLFLSTGGKKPEIDRQALPSKPSMATRDSAATAAQNEALTAFCLLLFNLNELIYVD